MKINKSCLLIVIFLCGLSAKNLFASASAAAAAIDDLGYELIEAVEDSEGDINQVQKLLDAGADVNATDIYGFTALMSAAEKGHTDIAELLLQKGAKVNTQDRTGHTALMRAAANNHEHIVQLLLFYKADKNIINDFYHHTAERQARDAGHRTIADIIRDYESGRRIKCAEKK